MALIIMTIPKTVNFTIESGDFSNTWGVPVVVYGPSDHIRGILELRCDNWSPYGLDMAILVMLIDELGTTGRPLAYHNVVGIWYIDPNSNFVLSNSGLIAFPTYCAVALNLRSDVSEVIQLSGSITFEMNSGIIQEHELQKIHRYYTYYTEGDRNAILSRGRS